MPWTVGQTVGYASRNAGAHITTPPKITRGVVEHITPSGRATVKFTRHDGGDFSGIFEANGRERGGSRYRSALFPWTDEHQKTWDAQQAEYDRRKEQARAAKEESAIQRKADQDAIDYMLTMLVGRGDPRAVRARVLLSKWRPDDV